ncbi:MAG: glycosyltransferase [Clostridia bacterium]|nr:glycosyltransferase [Clostridia bacterium]
MKIIHLSNYMNHHQLPIAQNLYNSLGEDYKYIALDAVPERRVQLGYEDINDKFSFIVRAYDSKERITLAKELIADSGVLFVGHSEEKYFKNALKKGKPVIKISERFFKENPTFINRVRQFIRAKRRLAKFQNKNFYFLCASAYTDEDVNKYTNFKGKTYRWGYFTELKTYDSIENLISKKEENSILWVGRFIDWKHPETPILVAKKLKENGYNFKLNMIGTGDMEENLKKLILDNGLEDCVDILGSKTPKEVREYMEKSKIYMFTSDQQEGWGAVLNESMNSGCAVVTNSQIGSVPFLMRDNENGLVYNGNDIEEIYKRVKYLLDNPKTAEEFGKNAYYTIKDEWSPEIAANRLLEFCKEIKDKGECSLFESGPCSRI